VCPVTAKIKEDITRKKHPPAKMHPPGHEVVNQYNQIEQGKLKSKSNGYIAHTYQN
jgi:hypothetical protein